MTEDLTVIGSTRTRTLRVLWILEELGLPFTHVPHRPMSDAMRAIHASGKVPVLMVGPDMLTDSAAILTFLADREGKFTHRPGTILRGQQDGLTQLILDEFDAVLWTAARHSFVLPQEMRLPAIKDSLKWEFSRNQARLAARLTGPYLMGDQMTVPDFLLTHCLNWAGTAGFPPLDPALSAYLDRQRARPAWVRAMAR